MTSVGDAAERGQVQRDDAGAAVVFGATQRAQRHDRRFAGDAEGLAEVIAVEHVVAGDDDLQIRGSDGARFASGATEIGRSVRGSGGAFRPRTRRFAERVDERGGGVDDFAAGEDDPAAVADDGVALAQEARVGAVLVLAALHVDVGLQAPRAARRRSGAG